MEEFLKDLGITLAGRFSEDESYVIDLPDSDTYGKMYSKLEKSELVDVIDDTSTVTYENSNIEYESDLYTINLISNFEDDTYKLVVRMIEE